MLVIYPLQEMDKRQLRFTEVLGKKLVAVFSICLRSEPMTALNRTVLSVRKLSKKAYFHFFISTVL